MSVVYDTGVLIAADRNHKRIWAAHQFRLSDGEVPVVTAPAVAQASRSTKQVLLRRFLAGCNIVPFAPGDAHEVGALLARAGTSDVVDAHVAVVAGRLDARIITSDPDDLGHLLSHLDHRVAVHPV